MTSLVGNNRVLVLLASFNGSGWIQDQISSLLRQKGVSVQVDVSDDLSSDGTDSIVDQISGREYRVQRRIRHERSGSAAKNFFRLMTDARDFDSFDYVAFSDQDDIWAEDKLIRSIECLEKSTPEQRLGLVSSSTTAFWPDGRRVMLRQKSNPTKFDYIFEGAGQGCSFVLTKEFFLDLRNCILKVPESTLAKVHYHDWLTYAILRRKGYSWGYIDSSLTDYRQHSANDTGAKGTFKALLSRVAKIFNGWYANQICAIVLSLDHIQPLNGQERRALQIDENGQFLAGLMPAMRRTPALTFEGRRNALERLLVLVANCTGALGVAKP